MTVDERKEILRIVRRMISEAIRPIHAGHIQNSSQLHVYNRDGNIDVEIDENGVVNSAVRPMLSIVAGEYGGAVGFHITDEDGEPRPKFGGDTDSLLAIAVEGDAAPSVMPSTTITAAYTITTADGRIRADASSAAFTVTMPTAASATGQIFVIKKIDSSINAITIDGSGAETIDGALTRTLTSQYDSLRIASFGTGWDID